MSDDLSGPKGGTADIIDLSIEREKREKPLGSYHVRVDLYESGCGGAILGMGDDLTPEVMRAVSENLMLLAWHIQGTAPSQGGVMATRGLLRPQPTLLERVEAYMQRYGLAPTQFGMIANREPALVKTLRKGRVCRGRVLAKVLETLEKPPPSSSRRGTRLAILYRRAKIHNSRTEAAAILDREKDPTEQAKRHLQRKGYRVFAMSVIDPLQDGWVVGNKPQPLTDHQLQGMARRYGWSG